MTAATPNDPHRAEWTDRLEDLIDGALAGTEREAVEKHVTGCEICSGDIRALHELDAALGAQIIAPRLDTEFDRKVRAQVASYDDEARQRAKQRAEIEFARAESSLANAWRKRRQRLLLDGVALIGCLCALGFSLRASGLWSTVETKVFDTTGTGALFNLAAIALVFTAISACVGIVLRSRDE